MILKWEKQQSKETYGQTRGLSNLEMKHVGELAIIGVLFKAVKTSRVRTTQGRTYLTDIGFFSLAFVAHILQTYTGTSRIARGAKLQLNTEW